LTPPPREHRVLRAGDEERLERFLLAHADTTMFLRGNSRRAGLEYQGERFQAVYMAALEGEEVVGVTAHTWRDSFILEAPPPLVEDLIRAAVEASGRKVTGLIGACAQVDAARDAFGWSSIDTILDSREILYRLELDALRVPRQLETGEHPCRIPDEGDVELLTEWQRGYFVEALGRTREQAREQVMPETFLPAARDGSLFLLEAGGERVAMTRFNTKTPDCVQVGGVWTPPPLRSRGYARSVVAGSLLHARAAGATRSILFTEEDNLPAQRCYQGLGYQVIGDYALVDFAEPQEI